MTMARGRQEGVRAPPTRSVEAFVANTRIRPDFVSFRRITLRDFVSFRRITLRDFVAFWNCQKFASSCIWRTIAL